MTRSKYNRRKRKRLHLGEYQQFGFNVMLKLKDGMTNDEHNNFFDKIIDIAEEYGLMTGGHGINPITVYFMPITRTDSLTQYKANKILSILKLLDEVIETEHTELFDCWNTTEKYWNDIDKWENEIKQKWIK